MPSLATQTQQGGGAGSLLILLLPLVLIGVMIWQQRRRSKAFTQAQAGLAVGQEVTTTSGMLGRLVELDDQIGSIEVAPGVVLRFDRRAVLPTEPVQPGQPGEQSTPPRREPGDESPSTEV